MSNLAFIAACFPDETLNRLIKNNDVTDIAANVFGYKICKCLSLSGYEVTVINEHKTYRFPKSNKVIIKGKKSNDNGVIFDTYSYFNIPFLDRVSKEMQVYKSLKKIKPKVVVVYCMHTPYLRPVIRLKDKLGCKIVLVVPDLPEFMLHPYVFPFNILKKQDIERLYQLTKYVDGFIILTKHMKERFPSKAKKFLVLEGIADITECNSLDNAVENRGNYIVYAGSLSKKYGLPEFIDSYIKSNIPEELYICGSGDYTEEIKNIASKNKKIKYLGFMNRNELHHLQKEASLLVNPRSCHDKYTMYSFPSKTLEYLVSGTPVMMEKLNGIPDEYYKYIIEVKNSDWISALRSFSKSNKIELFEQSKRARQYILHEKTVQPQAERIKSFIEELVNDE